MATLRIATWNANGVSQRKLELAQFLHEKHIDVMLLSETHLTSKYNFQIRDYHFYGTNHPDGKAHGGTAILIRNRMKHHFYKEFAENHLQATSINIQLDDNTLLTLAAVYCPPRFTVLEAQFLDFFQALGPHFIAAGDYNAKHTHWGSRLVNPKGKQLYKTIIKATNKLDHVSPGSPTYWPSDLNKLPDLIDFAVTKNISRSLVKAECLPDLSSDHSPVLIHLRRYAENVKPPTRLTSSKTNWLRYKKYISSHIELSPKLNTESDIESCTCALQSILTAAALTATPKITNNTINSKKTNVQIEQLVHVKRRLRREWQSSRSPTAKQKLKVATRKLANALKQEEDDDQRRYIEQLTPTGTKQKSLWRAHSTLRPPTETVLPIRNSSGGWARSDEDRATTFAAHLQNVFTPNQATSTFALPSYPVNRHQQHTPIVFRPKEITKIIKDNLSPKKSPGCDLITPEMIIQLPHSAVRYITKLFNAITKLGYFPQRWKMMKIIMIPKPGKNHTVASSYRPISLLSCISKLFEKCLLIRLNQHLIYHNIIPAHQFGFRESHGTIEQVNRITTEIRTAFEYREYCTAVFLDVSQAFDKVWLDGLMFKIKTSLPESTHKLLKSYLYDRKFAVRCNTATSTVHTIEAGVPQGSVLGPTLYLIYTADIPTNSRLTVSTFADDTAILSRSRSPIQATAQLALYLIDIEKWLSDWRIKVNEQKCKHVTFTLNRQDCPPLLLNSIPLPKADEVAYLGVHLDRRLTWRRHIEAKKTQLKLKANNLHWLINSGSPLSLDHKVLLYNSILKPIWTYGSQLWGNASNSNIDIIQRAQSKILRTITGAPWYVRSENIQRDLNIPSVTNAITELKEKYHSKLHTHPNHLARGLIQLSSRSRLRRKDLPTQRINY